MMVPVVNPVSAVPSRERHAANSMQNSPARARVNAFLSEPAQILAALVFAAALVPRLLWALEDHPFPFSDMEDYYNCAVNALRGKYLAMDEDRLAYRAPGYPLFLIPFLKGFPDHPLAALRIGQAFLGSATAVMVFYLALWVCRPLNFGPDAMNAKIRLFLSAGSGLTFAWFSGQIFFCGLVMSETLFVFAITAWALMALELKRHPRPWLLTAFSAWLGIMALIRPIALVFLPILVFVALGSVPRERWKTRIWAPLLAWLLPILPWTVRNAFLLGSFVLISTNSGVNFYIGHQPAYSYWNTGQKEAIRQYLAKQGVDEAGEDRFFFRLGMEYVLENPASLIPHSLMKLYYLYVLEEPPWPWAEYRGGTGPAFYERGWFPRLEWTPFLLLLSLAGFMYAAIQRLNHGVAASLIALYTAACLVYFARTRYRLPVEPFLIVYAWLGLLSLADTSRSAWRKAKRFTQRGGRRRNARGGV